MWPTDHSCGVCGGVSARGMGKGVPEVSEAGGLGALIWVSSVDGAAHRDAAECLGERLAPPASCPLGQKGNLLENANLPENALKIPNLQPCVASRPWERGEHQPLHSCRKGCKTVKPFHRL